MEKQLPRSRSMLGNGSGEEEKSANNHKESGESGTPQEGRPSEPCELMSLQERSSNRCRQETKFH
jgi:hypothetical protein